MPKKRLYKAVAERVLAATNELNAALMEAFEHPHVRVYLGPSDTSPPIQIKLEVTRITGHRIGEEEPRRFDLAYKVVTKPGEKLPKEKTLKFKAVPLDKKKPTKPKTTRAKKDPSHATIKPKRKVKRR